MTVRGRWLRIAGLLGALAATVVAVAAYANISGGRTRWVGNGALAVVNGAPSRTGMSGWRAPGATAPGSVPPVISSGPADRPWVALTFDSNLTDYMIHELDSGAVPSFYNVAVVDELEREAVPATFFLSGKWMQRYPEATRRLAANPLFELGSHSYAHQAFHQPCYHLAALPLDQMAADVRRSFEILDSFTARPTRYFRFPGDCYDHAALQAIAPVGCTVIHYGVASGDAFATNAATIIRHVLSTVHNGSIVVMHITGGNTAPLTAQALPSIIGGLRGKGFRLVRVSTLLAGSRSLAPDRGP